MSDIGALPQRAEASAPRTSPVRANFSHHQSFPSMPSRQSAPMFDTLPNQLVGEGEEAWRCVVVHYGPQCCGLNMRVIEGGFFTSLETGRIGRGAKFPPQLGQTPRSLLSTQSRQNVHSKLQIMASVADGDKSLSQHSQLGRS
jgi:hypothetical protein